MELRVAEQSNLPAVFGSNVPAIVAGMPSAQELMVYQTWAKNAAESQMYRNVGKESGIMMIMLAAREYGIGPAQALNRGLHIIEGKVELSARIMSALIRRSKHKLEILHSDDQMCRIKGTRADTGETHTVCFTIEMAQKAGLIKEKGGWKRTPEDMLYARCISRLARQLFSDCIGIGYIEGEIDASRASVCEIEASEVYEYDHNQAVKRLYDVLESDASLIEKFIREVGVHYNWTDEQTVMEMNKDLTKTKKRFIDWSKRNEKTDNVRTIDVTA